MSVPTRSLRAAIIGITAFAVVIAIRLADEGPRIPARAQTPTPTVEPRAVDLLDRGRVGCELHPEYADGTMGAPSPVEAVRRFGGIRGRLREVWREVDAAVVTETVDGKVVTVYRTGTFIDTWLVYDVSRAGDC